MLLLIVSIMGISPRPTKFVERNCCGVIIPTDRDERRIAYWNAVNDDVNNVYDIVITDQIFGNNEVCYLKLLNLYHFFLFYLENIQEERELYISQNGADQTNLYWGNLYCINSIRKTMLCRGMNSKALNEVLNLYNFNQTDTGVGIGDMIIEGSVFPFQVT